MHLFRLTIALLCLTAFSACGQKGSLYMQQPGATTTVVSGSTSGTQTSVTSSTSVETEAEKEADAESVEEEEKDAEAARQREEQPTVPLQ